MARKPGNKMKCQFGIVDAMKYHSAVKERNHGYMEPHRRTSEMLHGTEEFRIKEFIMIITLV